VRARRRSVFLRFVCADPSELRALALGLQSLMSACINQPFITSSRMLWAAARAAADDGAAAWGWSRDQFLKSAAEQALLGREGAEPDVSAAESGSSATAAARHARALASPASPRGGAARSARARDVDGAAPPAAEPALAATSWALRATGRPFAAYLGSAVDDDDAASSSSFDFGVPPAADAPADAVPGARSRRDSTESYGLELDADGVLALAAIMPPIELSAAADVGGARQPQPPPVPPRRKPPSGLAVFI
jgi:hypothetical protein